MGARWYDYELGRWTSPDSIVPELGNPQSLNRFSYCLNNPLAYVDPSGHDELWAWKNRWYNAHGWYWNAKTGHWDVQGTPYFADAVIMNEVIANSPETLTADNIGFGFEPSSDQQAKLLRASALSWRVAGFSSVECLARSAERAAILSKGNVFWFMMLMNAVFGHSGTGMGRIDDEGKGLPFVQSRVTVYSTSGSFLSDGFSFQYHDPDPTNDQVHHFWYYVQLAFFDEIFVHGAAPIGNAYHESPSQPGSSQQDFLLGQAGIEIGRSIGRGLSPYHVASAIRALGEPGWGPYELYLPVSYTE
jgi:hypothetical protein